MDGTDTTLTLGEPESETGAPPITSVTDDALPDGYTAHVHGDEINLHGIEVLVRNPMGNRVGHLCIQVRGERAHLWTLWVKPELRREGLGTYLITLFKEYVRLAGMNRVSGRVKSSEGVVPFLVTHGFPTGSLPAAITGRGSESPYGVVAIGAGDVAPGIEVAEALEQFPGIPAEDLLVGEW